MIIPNGQKVWHPPSSSPFQNRGGLMWVSTHTVSVHTHTYIEGGSHCPLSELPCLYTWMSRTYEPLMAVLLFPALLPVNSNDPASLSLSDIDCFHTFSGFCPQTFFLDFASRTFCCHKNRQKYSLRSTCWWQFFVGHWLYLRLAQRIMVPPAADILIFNLCSVTTFICYFWPFGMEWTQAPFNEQLMPHCTASKMQVWAYPSISMQDIENIHLQM